MLLFKYYCQGSSDDAVKTVLVYGALLDPGRGIEDPDMVSNHCLPITEHFLVTSSPANANALVRTIIMVHTHKPFSGYQGNIWDTELQKRDKQAQYIEYAMCWDFPKEIHTKRC
jgi:hypothetical protein